jgi:hypothetical protein
VSRERVAAARTTPDHNPRRDRRPRRVPTLRGNAPRPRLPAFRGTVPRPHPRTARAAASAARTAAGGTNRRPAASGPRPNHRRAASVRCPTRRRPVSSTRPVRRLVRRAGWRARRLGKRRRPPVERARPGRRDPPDRFRLPLIRRRPHRPGCGRCRSRRLGTGTCRPWTGIRPPGTGRLAPSRAAGRSVGRNRRPGDCGLDRSPRPNRRPVAGGSRPRRTDGRRRSPTVDGVHRSHLRPTGDRLPRRPPVAAPRSRATGGPDPSPRRLSPGRPAPNRTVPPPRTHATPTAGALGTRTMGARATRTAGSHATPPTDGTTAATLRRPVLRRWVSGRSAGRGPLRPTARPDTSRTTNRRCGGAGARPSRMIPPPAATGLPRDGHHPCVQRRHLRAARQHGERRHLRAARKHGERHHHPAPRQREARRHLPARRRRGARPLPGACLREARPRHRRGRRLRRARDPRGARPSPRPRRRLPLSPPARRRPCRSPRRAACPSLQRPTCLSRRHQLPRPGCGLSHPAPSTPLARCLARQARAPG